MSILIKAFKVALKFNASDVHIVPGEPIVFRRLGSLLRLKGGALSPSETEQAIGNILSDSQKQTLARDRQVDFVYEIPDMGRFRGSAMCHHNGLSAAFRVIPPVIPTIEKLGLPDIVFQILEKHQGLVLITGATGNGKSTTLAAMVDQVNATRPLHILTVEDPIELVHPIKQGIVNQRQLGRDTLSYPNALRAALREDPDVIMVGELRDLETISLAITAAETGHLVLATLSTSSGPKTIDRIIDAYPANQQNQVRIMLSEVLEAVITQRLIPAKDGNRLVLAAEVLINTLSTTNLIRDGKIYQIPSLMQTSKGIGMKIMDESILELLLADLITARDATRFANNPGLFEQYLLKEEALERKVRRHDSLSLGDTELNEMAA